MKANRNEYFLFMTKILLMLLQLTAFKSQFKFLTKWIRKEALPLGQTSKKSEKTILDTLRLLSIHKGLIIITFASGFI